MIHFCPSFYTYPNLNRRLAKANFFLLHNSVAGDQWSPAAEAAAGLSTLYFSNLYASWNEAIGAHLPSTMGNLSHTAAKFRDQMAMLRLSSRHMDCPINQCRTRNWREILTRAPMGTDDLQRPERSMARIGLGRAHRGGYIQLRLGFSSAP
jgi:hypothetical protein